MLLAFFISSLLTNSIGRPHPQIQERPSNIILVIVDGMGLAQVSLTEYLYKPPSPLARMSVVGLQKTHSSSHLETDSGAAGTAMSSGVKTFNAGIGVARDSTPVKTIMELSKENGMATGFVVTSSVVHATPASFYAHVPSRGSYEEIAKQLVASGMDVFVGGGERYFYNRNTDKLNLIQHLKNSNYEVVRSFDAPGKFRIDRIANDKKIACFTAFEDPTRATEGRKYLSDMAVRAKKALENRSQKGYFLMIEASQVDWAAHANDENWLALEMQDAYLMIEDIMAAIGPHENTLLIVTSDHETSYMSLKGKRSPRVEFNSKVHSSQMVPVFAYGPGADAFLGIYDNTGIFSRMKMLLGL